MIYIGIDPGLDGAVAIINDSKEITVKITPTIGKTNKQIDLKKFHEIFEYLPTNDIMCVIEDVHAIFGCSAGSTFSFGQAFMAPKAICMCARIQHTLVQPKKWQEVMHEGIPIMYKPLKEGQKIPTKDTKAMSLMALNRLFPNFDARVSTKAKNPHDGIVDAVLIAEYCRRMYK